ncbi:Uncharacterized damage-inducible protein DinB (forms a four-helix bundle) [Bryocella elongata]|uniref:Uncharacterized damage-inducible protein DinB (Forms a four-helix bundle) n=1 Tax=Bryocella elongata TaxID=863522 RepID=A0A1H6BN35_9BACT|nr:DUF1572 family protein [Bryocella elongata]SEG62103.1 Uncharacterized damage-inducible protein DinB (forms a four-helix bundle) [Bryocella elongata]
MPSNDVIAHAFLDYSSSHLLALQKVIGACCDKLNDEQMLHREGDFDNSVTNLLLHLAGNMRQWVMHGIAGHPDVRTRDAEFSLAPSESPAEARRIFDTTIVEAAQVLAAVDPARLMIVIDPQPNGTWRNPTILQAIYKVVGHVDHHAGQIITATKRLTASDLNLSMPRAR